MSTADGIVIFSGEKSTFGNVLVLDHGSGYTTFYGHCSTLEKQRGARVKRGDIIARVGNSGRSTFNHLHYEIRVDGAAQDPLEFIVRDDARPSEENLSVQNNQPRPAPGWISSDRRLYQAHLCLRL